VSVPSIVAAIKGDFACKIVYRIEGVLGSYRRVARASHSLQKHSDGTVLAYDKAEDRAIELVEWAFCSFDPDVVVANHPSDEVVPSAAE
jgi:hypothetical protein